MTREEEQVAGAIKGTSNYLVEKYGTQHNDFEDKLNILVRWAVEYGALRARHEYQKHPDKLNPLGDPKDD